jgi:transposase-like protein
MEHVNRPAPHTIAAKVIAHLEEKGGRLNREQIAKKFEVAKPQNVPVALRQWIEAGLLATEREGKTTWYSLGVPTVEETEAAKSEPLTIGKWNDGDVTVRGGMQQEDGSVLYSRTQVQQLLADLTQPHLILPAPIPFDRMPASYGQVLPALPAGSD